MQKKIKNFRPTYPIFFQTFTGNEQFFFLGLIYCTEKYTEFLTNCHFAAWFSGDMPFWNDEGVASGLSGMTKGAVVMYL